MTVSHVIVAVEEDLKKNLADITSAYELENVLKERYGVGGPNKKARSLSAAASMAVARITAAMQNQGGQAPGSLPNRTQGALAQALMGEPSQPGASLPLPIPPVGSPDHALAVQQPAPLAVQSSQELAGLLYIGAGLKDATAEGSGMPLGALVASPPATQTQAPSPELQALTHAEPAHEVEQQATTGEPQDNDAGQAAVVAMDTAAPAQPVATQAAVEATAAPVAPAVPAPPAIPDGAAAGAGASAGALAGVNLDLAALNTEAGSAQIAAALAAFPAIPPDTPLDINALRTQLMPGAVDINAILSGSFPSLPGGKLPDGAALAGLGSLPFSPASFNALMPQWNAMLANPMAWPLPAGLTLPQQGQQGNAGLLPGLAFPPGLLPGLGGEAQQLAPQLGNEGPGGGAQAKSAGRSGDKSAQGVGGDRPGRPPSYDDMVRWCVDLKRCLWQRHVPLTIEVSFVCFSITSYQAPAAAAAAATCCCVL